MQPPKTFNVGDTVWYIEDIKEEPQERQIVAFPDFGHTMPGEWVNLSRYDDLGTDGVETNDVFATIEEANQERLLRLIGAMEIKVAIGKTMENFVEECRQEAWNLQHCIWDLKKGDKPIDNDDS